MHVTFLYTHLNKISAVQSLIIQDHDKIPVEL